jgi:hypothetical protein
MPNDEKQESIKKFFEEKKYDSAEAVLVKLLKDKENDKQLLNALSLAYFHQKKFKKSIKTSEVLVKMHPKFYEGWSNYAHFLSNQESISIELLESSKECYLKSIEIDNNRTEGMLGLLKILILSNKGVSETLPNLSYGSEYELSNDKEIKSLLMDILKIDPTNVQVRQMGGLYYKSKCEWDNAIQFLENVVTNETAPVLLECMYEKEDKKEIKKFIDFFLKVKINSARAAKVTDFLSEQLGMLNHYNFCPKSLNYVFNDSILNYNDENELFSIEDIFSDKSYELIINRNKKNTVITDEEGNKTIVSSFNQSGSKELFEVYNSLDLMKKQNTFEIFLQNLLISYYNSQINEKNKLNTWFSKWPTKSSVTIEKRNTDKDFHDIIDYSSWASIIMFDSNLSKSKYEFTFDYLVPGLSVKNKKYKNKKFKVKSDDFLIFPSFLSPRVITKESNVNYYLLNIKPLFDAK